MCHTARKTEREVTMSGLNGEEEEEENEEVQRMTPPPSTASSQMPSQTQSALMMAQPIVKTSAIGTGMKLKKHVEVGIE